jgi:hypothetical protein
MILIGAYLLTVAVFFGGIWLAERDWMPTPARVLIYVTLFLALAISVPYGKGA